MDKIGEKVILALSRTTNAFLSQWPQIIGIWIQNAGKLQQLPFLPLTSNHSNLFGKIELNSFF